MFSVDIKTPKSRDKGTGGHGYYPARSLSRNKRERRRGRGEGETGGTGGRKGRLGGALWSRVVKNFQ